MNLNTLTRFAIVGLFAAGMVWAVPAHGAIIGFDIQAGSNTQADFTGVNAFPATDGTVTLSVSTNPTGYRDRGISAPITGNPDAAIMRDLAFWSTTNPITFTVSGLQANMEYFVTTWAFDAESGNSGKNIDFTTNGGTTSITTSNTDASYNPIALENFITDGTGTATIVMDHTGGAGGSVSFTNGFAFEAIPEPASLALALIGLPMIASRRRRS